MLDVWLPRARWFVIGTPIRQPHLCGLVGASSAATWAPSSEHFAGPQGEHHVRSATPGVSGRRRYSLAGRAGWRPAGRRRRPELHEQCSGPNARGQGSADIQVRAGEVGRQGHRQQLRQGGDRRATADLQGDRRRLDAAGARRDARAALARHRGRMGVRSRGPRPHHRRRAKRPRRDQRFRPRRRLVLPARPRPHAAMPRRQALSLHPDLRQRLLLRIRHLQHHRLGRAYAAGAVGEEFRSARSSVRNISEGGSVFCARQTAACRALGAVAGLEAAAGDPQIPPAGAAAACDLSGRSRVARRFQPLPDCEDDYGRRARSRSRCATDAALASERRRMAIRRRGRGKRHPVRLARPLPYRAIAEGGRRLHPARLWPLDRECWQRACARPDWI